MRSERNLILSAHAPMISAGVMAANFSWNAKNSSSGMSGARAGLTVSMPMFVKPA